ncbi:MAG: extracellular solute-binding protein [Eubacteriales bacterium]
MKNNAMRILAMLIASMLCAMSLASCGSGSADTPAATTAGGANDAQTTAAETEMSYDPGLPSKDYGGASFTILTKGVSSFNEWGETSIYTENENGDVVNDAIFQRNRSVEEKYNIKIAQYESSSPQSDTQKSVSAGDGAYDVVMPSFGEAGTLAAGGYLYDINEIANINLTKPWWDQRSVADLSVDNRLYFVSSDISTLNNDATWCTMFSKDLVNSYGVKSPYELVASNEWTYDNFYSMYKGVTGDLDGDGTYGPYDLFPNLTQNENYNAMYLGTGDRLISKDENDIPQIALGQDERSVKIIESLNTIMNDKQFSFNYHTSASDLGYHLWTTQMFEEGRGLFWITNLQIVIRLRDLDSNFGIVPVPKYSADQESYSNVVWTVGSYVAVPKTTLDIERTGIILEALAAKSMEVLRPAYYDSALQGKYLRDEESVEMLDIVIGERVYDLGLAFDFGEISGILQAVMSKNSTDIASTMAKKTSAIQAAIDKTITSFQENS